MVGKNLLTKPESFRGISPINRGKSLKSGNSPPNQAHSLDGDHGRSDSVDLDYFTLCSTGTTIMHDYG